MTSCNLSFFFLFILYQTYFTKFFLDETTNYWEHKDNSIENQNKLLIYPIKKRNWGINNVYQNTKASTNKI